MSYVKLKKTVYACTCEALVKGAVCGHTWTDHRKPEEIDACPKCRRHRWNGEDKRTWKRVKPKDNHD